MILQSLALPDPAPENIVYEINGDTLTVMVDGNGVDVVHEADGMLDSVLLDLDVAYHTTLAVKEWAEKANVEWQ